MTPKLRISWEEFSLDIQKLLQDLYNFCNNNHIDVHSENFKLLLPCRGGEIIGSLAKNFLGLSELQVIRIKFSNTNYENDKKGIIIKSLDEENFFKNLQNDASVTHILFLDDLLDTGETICFIREKLSDKKLIIGTLYYKSGKSDTSLLDLSARELPDIWIDFPWEDFYRK